MKTENIRPHQAGWLRRPELDTEIYDAWEMPDGSIHPAEPGREPMLVRLPEISILGRPTGRRPG